jgi:hypothetical protein
VSHSGHAWGKGNKPQVMLTVRFVGGDEMLFPYIELAGVRFNRSEWLKLYFHTATVTIQGVTLDKMTGILQEHRVKYVHE